MASGIQLCCVSLRPQPAEFSTAKSAARVHKVANGDLSGRILASQAVSAPSISSPYFLIIFLICPIVVFVPRLFVLALAILLLVLQNCCVFLVF